MNNEYEDEKKRYVNVGKRTYDKAEQSILLYLETCLVDQRGHADGRRMNESDHVIIKRWVEEDFIHFGRLPMACIDALSNLGIHASHWVRFSNDAWYAAHQIRIARAHRMIENDPTESCQQHVMDLNKLVDEWEIRSDICQEH